MLPGFFGYVQEFAIYSPIIPLFFIFLYWKDIRQNPLATAILLLLCLDFSTDMVSQILVYWTHLHDNTQDIQQVYFFLFSYTSYNVFKQGITNPKALKTIKFLYAAVALFMLYFIITDLRLLNTLVRPSSFLTALNIFVAIYYFYETFIEMKIKSLVNHPFFWVNSALLLYVGGGFIFQLFQNAMDRIVPGISGTLWPIYNISTIIFNLLILRAIWLMKKA